MDPSDNGITQAMRYKDVPTALSYTLIHLSGDYPLLDYSLTGKFICFLMCLFAASVVQVSLPPPPRLGCMRGRAEQCGQRPPCWGEAAWLSTHLGCQGRPTQAGVTYSHTAAPALCHRRALGLGRGFTFAD